VHFGGVYDETRTIVLQSSLTISTNFQGLYKGVMQSWQERLYCIHEEDFEATRDQVRHFIAKLLCIGLWMRINT